VKLAFGAQNPGHPWWWLGARITERLVGFGDSLLPAARISLVTPTALQGALFNPVDVGSGLLDLAITTPSVTARMAAEGTGPYTEAFPALRALAAYPHIDYIVLLVEESLGVSSLEEIIERHVPLRLVTGRRTESGEQDVLTFAVEEILRAYGASYDAIEEWGGAVTFGGATHVGGSRLLDGRADALFHEAQMSPMWAQIAAAKAVRVLPIRDDVRTHMHDAFGFGSATVPAGHPSGAVVDTPTIDFGGWLVFCRDDLPDDVAYAVARAVDETRAEVEADQAGRGEIAIPIEPRALFGDTAIPLHDGARAYAEEHGYLTDRGRS
jgi:TRAP-type uncharacterized transport system substrate-binding protein